MGRGRGFPRRYHGLGAHIRKLPKHKQASVVRRKGRPGLSVRGCSHSPGAWRRRRRRPRPGHRPGFSGRLQSLLSMLVSFFFLSSVRLCVRACVCFLCKACRHPLRALLLSRLRTVWTKKRARAAVVTPGVFLSASFVCPVLTPVFICAAKDGSLELLQGQRFSAEEIRLQRRR